MPSRVVEDLHPSLQPICRQFISLCRSEGIQVFLTTTYRSPAEQETLYAQGRTAPGRIVTNARAGQSPHNFQINGKPAAKAFDIAIRKDDQSLNWDGHHPHWKRVGEIGKSLGLRWGADFRTIRDLPHFELTEHP